MPVREPSYNVNENKTNTSRDSIRFLETVRLSMGNSFPKAADELDPNLIEAH